MSDALYTDTCVHTRLLCALRIYSVEHGVICARTKESLGEGSPGIAQWLPP